MDEARYGIKRRPREKGVPRVVMFMSSNVHRDSVSQGEGPIFMSNMSMGHGNVLVQKYSQREGISVVFT